MPVYEYQAIDAAGRNRNGKISADSHGAALLLLRRQSLYPKRLTEAAASVGQDRTAFRAGRRTPFQRVSKAELGVILRQLSNLLTAGFPLLRAVSLIRAQARSKALAHVLAQVEERLKEGVAFARALEEHPSVFPDIHVGLVRAAESSGTLEIVMATLADVTERQLAMHRKIVNALTYPGIMLVVGIGVVFVLMTFVVPRIARIFTDLQQDLPLATVLLIETSGFCQRYWPVMAALAVLTWIGGRLFVRLPKGRRLRDRTVLALPLLGSLAKGFALARFSRTLGTVLRHGIPVPQALDSVGPVLGNVVLEQCVAGMRRDVAEGASLTAAMLRHPEFPPIVTQMAAAGEAAGNLDAMMLNVSAMLEDENVNRMTILTSLFEPAMIILLGCGVCFIVMAVLLPIFDMSTHIR